MFLESVECHGGRGLDLMTLAGSGIKHWAWGLLLRDEREHSPSVSFPTTPSLGSQSLPGCHQLSHTEISKFKPVA